MSNLPIRREGEGLVALGGVFILQLSRDGGNAGGELGVLMKQTATMEGWRSDSWPMI
jgi:hypothetical protein